MLQEFLHGLECRNPVKTILYWMPGLGFIPVVEARHDEMVKDE